MSNLTLTYEEQAMLDGAEGPGVKRAMAIVVALARIYAAVDLVPVGHAQSAGVSYKLKSKEITIAADDEFTLKVGQSTLYVNSGQIVISGSNIQVSATGALTLKGSSISEN